MPRAAIYLRVSTRGQDDDGSSLETQEAGCAQHLASRGFTEWETYREVHTGVELWERPELTRLRDAIRRREVSCVVCYAIDRLARDPVHLGVVLSEADHHGAAVEFVTEPLDSSPEGQLIRFVRGYAAKVEHEKIKERTRRGRRARLDKGLPLRGKHAPYGYRWTDPLGLAAEPSTAPVVRRLYRGILQGDTTRALAIQLTQDGVPTPRGETLWNYSTVRYILSNPVYQGTYIANRWNTYKRDGVWKQERRPISEQVALVNFPVEPLVTPNEWQAVQDQLQSNRARAARSHRDPTATLLRGGFALCSGCGNRLQAHFNTGQDVWRYDCIMGQKNGAKCPHPVSISAKNLDAAVWGRVSDLLDHPERVAAKLQQRVGADPALENLAAVAHRLQDVEKRSKNLVNALAQLDGAAQGAVLGELQRLGEEQTRLAAEHTALVGRQMTWQQAQFRIEEVVSWCGDLRGWAQSASYEKRRLALAALGVQVTVYPVQAPERYAISLAIPLEVVNTAPPSTVHKWRITL